MLIGIHSDYCEVDAEWRLHVGALPRFRHRFDTTVTLIGHGRFFELWRTDRYWEGLTSFDPDEAVDEGW